MFKADDMNAVINNVRNTEKSMRVSVKIPHDEVDRLIINRLINIRNSQVNASRDMGHIDKTIKHFLTEDEFQKYAIEKQEIEF